MSLNNSILIGGKPFVQSRRRFFASFGFAAWVAQSACCFRDVGGQRSFWFRSRQHVWTVVVSIVRSLPKRFAYRWNHQACFVKHVQAKLNFNRYRRSQSEETRRCSGRRKELHSLSKIKGPSRRVVTPFLFMKTSNSQERKEFLLERQASGTSCVIVGCGGWLKSFCRSRLAANASTAVYDGVIGASFQHKAAACYSNHGKDSFGSAIYSNIRKYSNNSFQL